MKSFILSALIFSSFFVSGGFSLQQTFPEPSLRNPSFEDHCADLSAGFFFAPDPSLYSGIDINNVSLSNAPPFMKWNISGQGLQVVYGGASDGDCYLTPFWAGEAGGVKQTLSTAANASYLLRFDMRFLGQVCGDSFPGVTSIQLSAGGRNVTKYQGSSGRRPWFSLMYQFQASSYRTELSISGSEGSCGLGVDNLRVELVRDASSSVLSNGGFELADDLPADPGFAGYQLQARSVALSSWVVTGNGVTCFGSSVFPPTEGQRLIWLATQDSFTQEPSGLTQTLSTIANTTYHISFDATCQCNATMPYCLLKVALDGGLGSLNFTLLPQNPGWSRRAVEFTAVSNQTAVTFQDASPGQNIRGVVYNICAPYLDNVVVTIPAQQALLKLKTAVGSPKTLVSWDGNFSDPCLIPPSTDMTWAGVTCAGALVTGLDLSGLGLSRVVPFELFALYPTLKSLNLSNNLFIGSIPSFLAEMQNLLTLDLSNNRLQGVIPSELGTLSLQKLDMHGNELHGGIPNTLAIPSLKVLNLQGNNLSGRVPEEVSLLVYRGTNLMLRPGNDHLCSDFGGGGGVKSCSSSGSVLITGIMITVAVLAGTVACSCLWAFIIHRLCRRPAKDKITDAWETIDLKLDACRAFSFQELEEATQQFSVVLGRGGYGTVCEAHLKDGRVAAVKQLNQVSGQGPQEFISEVELLSRLHHANLVTLLGYCFENREYILVYEFMPKGSLYDILHKPVTRQPLAWEHRMKIAQHMAFGIEYLHYFASPGLVHRDIKSSNILLDERNNAKVADFGLSKESPKGADEAQTTAIKGSFGYLDPAYVKTNKLSTKSDVYSFGVILLELITGRRPIMEGELLTDWCNQFYELDVSLMLDPALTRHYVKSELSLMVGIARDRVNEDRELRPDMRSITHQLSELTFIKAPSPTSSSSSYSHDEVLHLNNDKVEADMVSLYNDSSELLPR